MKKTSNHTKISASADEMFIELRDRGIFWSYSPETTYKQEDIEDDEIVHLYPKEQISKEQIRDFFQVKLNRMAR